MKKQRNIIKLWGATMMGLSLLLIHTNQIKAEGVDLTGSPTHIGTFEGSTTFATSSSNGLTTLHARRWEVPITLFALSVSSVH